MREEMESRRRTEMLGFRPTFRLLPIELRYGVSVGNLSLPACLCYWKLQFRADFYTLRMMLFPLMGIAYWNTFQPFLSSFLYFFLVREGGRGILPIDFLVFISFESSMLRFLLSRVTQLCLNPEERCGSLKMKESEGNGLSEITQI